jgi:ubiquinone/menaquinone biosynthesis C-methylase UbiE
MIEAGKNVFRSGEFFSRFTSEFEDSRKHVDILTTGYEQAFSLIESNKYPNPLEKEHPRILQIGSACYTTASTFADFVYYQNPESAIVIADISDLPLRDCLTRGLSQRRPVTFLQADTHDLPFEQNSFDWIETDALLQYMPNKEVVLREWFRLLRPDGILTTREWLLPDRISDADYAFYEGRREYITRQYSVTPYGCTRKELAMNMETVGFESIIQSRDQSSLRKFIHDIVAKKL